MDHRQALARAYLIDRAIMLHPAVVMHAFDMQPSFAQNQTYASLSNWGANELAEISGFFWENEAAHREAISEFNGAGVKPDRYGSWSIVLYCGAKACQLFKHVIAKISQRFEIGLTCEDIGVITFAAFKKNSPFCYSGTCIQQPSGAGQGVLGAWLKNKMPQLPKIGLTNNHVAAEFNKNKIGTKIYDLNGSIVGNLRYFERLIQYDSLNPGNPNLADLALISPQYPNHVGLSFKLGSLIPQGKIIVDSLSIVKHVGLSLKLIRKGKKIIKGSLINRLPLGKVEHNGKKYEFKGVLLTDMGKMGDSGSLVMDDSNCVVGMYFATNKDSAKGSRYGYINPWQHIERVAGSAGYMLHV